MNILGNTFILKIVIALISSISPILLAELQTLIDRLKIAAQQSANPWDDILVEFLEELITNIARRDN